MLIVIPSKARATKQTTYGNLPASLKRDTIILVEPGQTEAYQRMGFNCVVTAQAQSIAPCRQWIVEEAIRRGEKKIVMLDDDLVFARRRDDDPTKFRAATDDDIVSAFEAIDSLLDNFAHVSISPREGGNRRTEQLTLNTRTMRVLGYRLDTLARENIRFDKIQFMEDFYVSLSLLTRGYENCSINWLVQNQNGSDLPGGCSTIRTPEKQTAAAEFLKSQFPDFVTLVTKQTKSAWGGKPRTDVIIQWKQALAYGKSRAAKTGR